ncbi:MAG TPA: tetratricopeptide repeat protein [Longimicrobiales bacterium]|nr:tetratricopeptide repeat protein [Longimicrobiales bacterium]
MTATRTVGPWLRSVYADLKRRRVLHLAFIYIAAGWLVIQVADTLESHVLSSGVARGIIYIVLAGFPIALVLAWFFDISLSGIRLTPPLLQSLTNGEASLAVLPFRAAERASASLADGMTEEVLTALTRVAGVRIAARGGAVPGDDARDLRSIGDALGARYVLEGTVRRDGERIRITTQLTDVVDGRRLLVETFDRAAADVYGVQVEVAQATARALRTRLGAARSKTGHVPDPEAYTRYLDGLHHLTQRTPATLTSAQRCFEDAIARDPAFGPAHARRAETLALLGDMGVLPPQVALPDAMEAARTAIELDESDADAHAALGFASTLSWEWSRVEASFQRALSLNPHHAAAHHWFALYLCAHGRLQEAVQHAESAHALAPDASVSGALAALYYYAGRHDRALALAARLLATSDDNVYARVVAALAHEQRGELAEARHAVQQAMLRAGPADPFLITTHGHILAAAGDATGARAALDRLARIAETRPVSSFCRAALHTALDERDAAFTWLERGRGERDGWLLALLVHPWLEPLRRDVRFRALATGMGLDAGRAELSAAQPPAPPLQTPTVAVPRRTPSTGQ